MSAAIDAYEESTDVRTAWYTDNVPESDAHTKDHFSHNRMMLGICIKRYGMDKNGRSYRNNTHIDVPLELASPHFTTGDEANGEGTDISNFKLVLKSFVCHRGHSVDAGHYIAFFRVEAPVQDQREAFAEATTEQQTDRSHDMWLKFDDLASERITSVDVNRVLRDETPYLLFYRVQAISDDLPDETPPPYQESQTSLDLVDSKLRALDARQEPESRRSTEQPSNRPSIEVTGIEDARRRPPLSERQSSDRRQSTTASSLTEPPSEVLSPESTRNGSPAINKSHPRAPKSDGRQSDEINQRFSLSMSKLAARLSRDKLNSPDILVHEVSNDSVGQPGPGVDDPVLTAQPVKAPPVVSVASRPPIATRDMPVGKEQEKEKKKKFRLHGRRGSTSNTNGKPDRECIVM